MVTLENLADETGQPTPSADSQQARQWLMWRTDALLQIKARLGDPAELDPEMVDYVVRKAVSAKVKQPDGLTEYTTSYDDTTVTRRYAKASGDVTIADEWWKLLDPSLDVGDGAFSVRPAFEPDAVAADAWI